MRDFIVFAKEPEPGKVKTRLTPPLEPAEAVELYQSFVRDVLELGPASGSDARARLAAPGETGPFLTEVAGNRYQLEQQVGADLGARMHGALERSFLDGASAAVLVGTDSPSLPPDYVEQAYRWLEEGADLVLGPATDGGYVLIGASGQAPDVFKGVEWSTEAVLTQTLARALENGVDARLLPFWYDVDTADDLRWLAAHLSWQQRDGQATAVHTWGALQRLAASRKGFLPCV